MTTKDLQEKVKDKELIIEVDLGYKVYTNLSIEVDDNKVRIFETPEAEKLLIKYYFQHSLFYTLKDPKNWSEQRVGDIVEINNKKYEILSMSHGTGGKWEEYYYDIKRIK